MGSGTTLADLPSRRVHLSSEVLPICRTGNRLAYVNTNCVFLGTCMPSTNMTNTTLANLSCILSIGNWKYHYTTANPGPHPSRQRVASATLRRSPREDRATQGCDPSARGAVGPGFGGGLDRRLLLSTDPPLLQAHPPHDRATRGRPQGDKSGGCRGRSPPPFDPAFAAQYTSAGVW